MTILQFIYHRGRPAAVVLGAGRAAIADHVTAQDRPTVEAMCLYAMEIAGGDRPGPYRDEDASSTRLRC